MGFMNCKWIEQGEKLLESNKKKLTVCSTQDSVHLALYVLKLPQHEKLEFTSCSYTDLLMYIIKPVNKLLETEFISK